MTADSNADLMRAAGVEKMARAIWQHEKDNYIEYPDRPTFPDFDDERDNWIGQATAALAAWEAHLAEQKKSPG